MTRRSISSSPSEGIQEGYTPGDVDVGIVDARNGDAVHDLEEPQADEMNVREMQENERGRNSDDSLSSPCPSRVYTPVSQFLQYIFHDNTTRI